MGRKSPKNLDRYKTICWISHVKKMSGKSAYSLEYELFPELQEIKDWYDCRPRILEKYQKGKAVPNWGPHKKTSNVTKLEKLYPDTEWLFTHMFWRTVEPDVSIMENIDAILYILNRKVKAHLFDKSNLRNFPTPFQRSKLSIDLAEDIAGEYTLDSLAVLMLLLNEAEVNDQSEDYVKLMNAYDKNYSSILKIPYFFDQSENILSYIDFHHPFNNLPKKGVRASVLRLRW